MQQTKGLSKKAYEVIPEGSTYDPYVAPTESPLEFTFKSVLAGVLFGILFGAANAYLGLRAGLTISTSIPIAVMTVAGFRLLKAFGTPSTILESNMSQTIGSASSSVASGVIFTLPALFLWNLEPKVAQMTLIAILGGILGTLFMVLLRKFLIDREHGKLPYPEGTACAEVLVASEAGDKQSKNVFLGLGAGAFFKFLTGWIHVIPSEVQGRIPFIRKAQIGSEMSAALLGVGYILGPRIGAVMVSGGLLSSLIIIPAIAYWGGNRTEPLYPETTKTIVEMTSAEIWSRYVRYIGAGAVAAAGLFTLLRGIPMMIASFQIGARQMKEGLRSGTPQAIRTDRDLPFHWILGGVILMAVLIVLTPHLFGQLNHPVPRIVATLLVVILAFFFVTVASRIVGLVGVTSNPTSGMTIASLLATSLVFLSMGWTDDAGKAGALVVGAIIAIAASISGDMSQDLKTGFLLGATPYKQQVGEIIGVVTSAFFVCMTVVFLDQAYGFGTKELPAPQATLMKLVIEGVLQQSLPWILVATGAGIAVLAEVVRLPSLAFAVGVYLPITTMVPVFLGGLLRLFLEKRAPDKEEAIQIRERGVLFGSGLVGGEGLLGVGIAAMAVLQGRPPAGLGFQWAGAAAPFLSLFTFATLALYFAKVARRIS